MWALFLIAKSKNNDKIAQMSEVWIFLLRIFVQVLLNTPLSVLNSLKLGLNQPLEVINEAVKS